MPKLKHLTLDGRTLEGGGQLLRIAVCLSALTSTPLKIHDIRGNRAGGGGLKAQHLASVKWLAEACNAHVEGAEKGSTELVFEPGQGKLKHDSGVSSVFNKKALPSGEKIWEVRLDIGTAGSTGLALQAILPFILFSSLPGDESLPIHLALTGGTNVSGSPSYEYITQVLLPTLKAVGLPEMKAVLRKRGWSQGGSSIGSLTVEIPARDEVRLKAFTLAPPELLTDTEKAQRKPRQMMATVLAPTSCHAHLKQIFVSKTRDLFVTCAGSHQINEDRMPISIRCADSGHDKRLYLIAVLTLPVTATKSDADGLDSTAEYTIASDWLYDSKMDLKSKTRAHDEAAENMVNRVLTELEAEWRSGAFVDEHLRDQLIIFQALAKGKSSVYPGQNSGQAEDRNVDSVGQLREPSLHTQTAVWVVNEMLGVDFDGQGGCEGCGFDGKDQVDWLRLAKARK